MKIDNVEVLLESLAEVIKKLRLDLTTLKYENEYLREENTELRGKADE